MSRRAFVAGAAAFPFIAKAVETATPPLIGIQVAGHSLLDEGIERCLDLIQSTCRANAIFLYSHSHYAAHNRPPAVYADHGVPIKDERKRKITRLWLRHHDERFKDTSLRFEKPGADEEYGDRDLFAEMAEVCQKRGLKFYARILEPGLENLRGRVRNAERAISVDIHGNTATQPCRNNPEWIGFWDALVDDTLRSYPLDGYQWGAESAGPLSELLWRGTMPFCFCEHCIARAKREGINAERAKQGFTRLHKLITGLREGGAVPPEGVFTNTLRVLMQFPEVLAWDYQWRLALEEQGKRTHAIVKAARPTAQVGRHLDHQNTSWDALFAAQFSYADIAPHADFIKPILYHDILGPRLRWWHLERLKQGPLRELPLQQSLDLFYSLRGYDVAKMPALDELDRRGLGAEYVGRETRRIVETVHGRCAVIPGIGVDVPDNIPRKNAPPPGTLHSTPEGTRAAVTAAFANGASGILISREYDEMRVENLNAIGETLRELGKV